MYRLKLHTFLQTRWFEYVVISAISLNAVTLGLETYPSVMSSYGEFLLAIDFYFILFFITEITLRLVAHGRGFFREGWNWFDFVIVGITVLPFLGIAGLGNVSAFRALRVLRLLAVIPAFRRVLQGIGRALAGSIAVMIVLTVILYVYGVIAVKVFRDISPELFPDLGGAIFTLFQIMTLDAWSDIVRPIMNVYWWSGLFFASFIITTVFILLSIVIGIASNAMADDRTRD